MADLQYVLRYAVILAGAFVSLHDFSLAQTCSGHSDCPGVGGCCCTHDTPYEVMIEQCSRDVSEPGARRRRRDIHALNTCINEARPHSNPAGEIPGACECKEGYKAAAPSGSCVEMDRVEAEHVPGAAALCAAVTDLYPTTNVNDGTMTQNYAPIWICLRLTSRNTSDWHELRCGRSGSCSEEPPRCANNAELHEVGCCADTEVADFTKRAGCDVWGARNPGDAECQHSLNFDDASAFCASVGGRLCTVAELEADCNRGGCGYDDDLLWSTGAAVSN